MLTHPKRVIVVGAGPAGMQAALSLAAAGVVPVMVDRAEGPGGHLREWHNLFPTGTPAREVLAGMAARLAEAGVGMVLGTEVGGIGEGGRGVVLADGRRLEADAVVLAHGFELFDARLKEEYGYGVYDNVVTTADVERMMNDGRVALVDGTAPRRVAFVHCVGSRDEKVNQRHCSKVCCVTAVKQAMELRERFPEADIFNFYMDIRMFGPGYEELYQAAQQQARVQFIRGRVSEASPTIDGRIQIKAEDTLIGRPMKMTVDMLVLVVGMKAAAANRAFAASGVEVAPSGFVAPRDLFAGSVETAAAGVFVAGAATAPKTIGESMAEGAMAARCAAEYVNRR